MASSDHSSSARPSLDKQTEEKQLNAAREPAVLPQPVTVEEAPEKVAEHGDKPAKQEDKPREEPDWLTGVSLCALMGPSLEAYARHPLTV